MYRVVYVTFPYSSRNNCGILLVEEKRRHFYGVLIPSVSNTHTFHIWYRSKPLKKTIHTDFCLDTERVWLEHKAIARLRGIY